MIEKMYCQIILNNNIYSVNGDSSRFRSIVRTKSLPLERFTFLVGTKARNTIYDPLEIIGIAKEDQVYDVITGELIVQDEDNDYRGLSYSKSKSIEKSKVIDILKRLKTDDIARYKKSIDTVKKEAIRRYDKTHNNIKR